MPVAGKETVVQPVSRLSSDYIASVPIKKRKHLLYATTSPQREEQEPSTQPAGNNKLQKEHSSINQGSAISNASIGTRSSSLCDMNKNSISEVRNGKALPTNGSLLPRAGDHIKVKLEEPNLSISHSSLDRMSSKEKLLAAELSAKRPMTSGNTKFQLASKEALTPDIRKVTSNKGSSEENCSSDTSTITGNIELSLGLKENLIPSFGRQDSNGSCGNEESLEPLSLNLCLNERKGNDQCKRSDVHSSTDSEKLPRSNWDLNTTMDAWEGPVRDAALDQLTAYGLNINNGVLEVKPLICSSSSAGAGVALENKIIEKIEHRPNPAAMSASTGQRYYSMDSLNLRLSPTFLHSNFDRESSSSSSKVDSIKVVSNLNLPKALVSTSNLNSVGRIVKPEPVDESMNQDLVRLKGDLMRPVEHSRPVKHEFVEKSNEDAPKFPSLIPPKYVNPISVKSEAGDHSQGTLKKVEETLHHSGKQVLGPDNHSSILHRNSTSHLLCSSGKPTSSTELNRSGDVSNHSNASNYTPMSRCDGEVLKEECNAAEVVSLEASVSGAHVCNKPNVSGVSEAECAEDKNVKGVDPKFVDEMPPGSRGNEGASVSDEEKVNISGDMIEEDYGSDYESDGNHAVAVAMDIECSGGDDDYEDGEVRDAEVPTVKEGLLLEKNVGHLICGEQFDCKKKYNVDECVGDESTSLHIEGKNANSEDPGETTNYQLVKCDDVDNDEKHDNWTCKFPPLQDSQAIQVPTNEPDNERAIKGKSLDVSGMEDTANDQEMEQLSDEAAGGSKVNLVTAVQHADEEEKKIVEEKNESSFSKMESSLNADDGTKDVSSGGNRSRIINLAQASSASSPGKVRSIAGRPLPSRTGKDRLPDVALDGEKPHPRGRDDIYMDDSPKFSRDRHQDQSFRNSRWNYTRGRGRGSSRSDSVRGEWNSERGFAPQFYNAPTEFRIPRHKYTAPDENLEYSTYNMAPDTAFVGTGRGGRKLISDEGEMYRHLPSRRRSPGGREGPLGRGLQMVRRVPRNGSPSRCISDDGSEMVGLRRNEKCMRGFPDDNTDPGFSRTQHHYEGVDGHFVRGNKNFSSGQRRGLPRIRSKSPVRSRTRSPGPRSSPRRRSPDDFVGHPEMPRRRSPAIFRIDRMRPPERPCFPGDMVVRRQGSPPYMFRPNNDLRDMESGREHGHPRSVISNRSPTGRVLLRNNRRFDIVDPRERADADEYFGGPIHSGRFHELGGDGNGDDRRRFGERRGPVRSFRPAYNSADGENFHLNAEDASRPFRFGPDDDSEFNERGNMRERDFDRRIKTRPGNAPRRARNVEEQEGNFRNSGGQDGNFRNNGQEGNFRNNSGQEGNFRNGSGQEGNFRNGNGQEGNFRNGNGQEGNFRNGGQQWHDEGFDDVSRLKRKRF